jgi:hypothetical protein
MITTETFTNFARRLAATKGYPDVIIAETPNPLRQLDDASLQQRAEAMLSTIIAGLTQSPERLKHRQQQAIAEQLRPAGVIRAARPV